MKKGFSLAELMIAMVVAGTIAALTIPVLMGGVQNNYDTLYKAAFRTVEQVVHEQTNDLSEFPNGLLDNSVNAGNHHFCQDFSTKVNTLDGAAGIVECDGTNSAVAGNPNFVTTNGMRWYGFENEFPNNPPVGTTPSITIRVDVDGVNRGPNLATGANRDIFQIIIFETGRVTAPAGLETTFLTQ